MYVFSLVLCLWDAPNKKWEEKGEAINAFFPFFNSVLPLCCRFFISAYSLLIPRRLGASASRPLGDARCCSLLLLAARTG